MKKSKYIVTAKYNYKLLAMSLVSKDILVVDDTEIEDFNYSLNNCNNITTKYFNQLFESSFIIDDDVSEIEELKKYNYINVENPEIYTITIIPTFLCNLKCSYCYESNMNFLRKSFTINDWENLYLFIEKIIKNGIKKIGINFYGGEPSLKADEIKNFINKISKNKDFYHVSFHYSISTNLHNIKHDFLNFMIENKFKRIDTTIAGTKKIHNLLRKNDALDDNYDFVIKNIKTLVNNNINVCICINVSKYNINNLIEIIDNISSEINSPRIYFSFLKIFTYANCHCEEIVVEESDYQTKIIEAMNYCLDNNINVMDMSCFESNGIFCSAYLNNSISVAPGGLVFKCSEQFSPDNSFGYLKDGEVIITNPKLFECKNCFKNEKCIKCKYLPYCYGGCMESERRGRSACPPELDFFEQYLILYYKRILKGGENNEGD